MLIHSEAQTGGPPLAGDDKARAPNPRSTSMRPAVARSQLRTKTAPLTLFAFAPVRRTKAWNIVLHFLLHLTPLLLIQLTLCGLILYDLSRRKVRN